MIKCPCKLLQTKAIFWKLFEITEKRFSVLSSVNLQVASFRQWCKSHKVYIYSEGGKRRMLWKLNWLLKLNRWHSGIRQCSTGKQPSPSSVVTQSQDCLYIVTWCLLLYHIMSTIHACVASLMHLSHGQGRFLIDDVGWVCYIQGHTGSYKVHQSYNPHSFYANVHSHYMKRVLIYLAFWFDHTKMRSLISMVGTMHYL